MVHVIASVEEIRYELTDIVGARKIPFPKAILYQAPFAGEVLGVQFIPLVEEAAAVLYIDTAANTPFP